MSAPETRARPDEDATFAELRRRARSAYQAGQLEEALRLYDEAWEWAQEHGDAVDVDRAFCGRASVAIELGQGDGFVPELRRVLMANADHENCFLSAYNLARAYELRKANKKGLFYARVARDRAEVVGRSEWLASSHNLIGNLLLAESFFQESCGEYEEALRCLPAATSIRHALIKDNLGYAYVVQGRVREGFSLLYESLRTLRRFGAVRYQIYPRLSLCFAHLEVGRLRSATRQGRIALAAAELAGDRDAVKNALFLLGEAANLAGEHQAACDHFGRLQQRFYPDAGYLPQFLMAIDVRKMINLKA